VKRSNRKIETYRERMLGNRKRNRDEDRTETQKDKKIE
jgi:hypothetical protein